MTEQKEFRRALFRWYRKNGRDLPWRHTRDPYRILVSEFMLQQTQVATVLPYYKNWLRRFPNFATLSRASESEALRGWEGLGYYARARNLHSVAKLVTGHHRRFPTSIEDMRKLPGVGKYSAHAVATFAFNQAVPIVEANSARVLARLFDIRDPIDSMRGRDALWDRATSLVPKRNAAAYNSALLDLGSLVCLPRNPKCGICPVKKFCRTKNPEALPIKRARARTISLIERHALIIRRNRILLQPAADRWRGMWILPTFNRASRNNGAIYSAIFPFTNHRITLEVFRGGWTKINKHRRWFSKSDLSRVPIPSPHRRAIEQLFPAA